MTANFVILFAIATLIARYMILDDKMDMVLTLVIEDHVSSIEHQLELPKALNQTRRQSHIDKLSLRTKLLWK